ncbi:uncharacterized protein BP5553_01863 [Venustampulla echinocandica]|uniref:Uncharacterized protein n=1 Tax=Venustampulla echinocandica TaxID=2656787 RepID=A0A370U278_9HELO|nr:uncharacterized protein BP5553_01863 [Venustampulla echinocandica]RDL41884.1 hypothetical protein BP5553_01863 [Venustampulla echinocandica]
MHYIRFLKPPRLQRGGSASQLTAKITLTTDLGESFLWADIRLVVELVGVDGKTNLLAGGKEYLWKGSEGMRSLEVSLPIPISKGRGKAAGIHSVRMLVRPVSVIQAVDTSAAVLGAGDGGLMAVRSMAVDTNPPQNASTVPSASLAERVINIGKSQLHIWEETGESIARHIWDAGLVLSSYLTSISNPSSECPSLSEKLPKLPALQNALTQNDIHVLELGAGCGVVGITVSHAFPNISQIILTDLPEATEILSHNLSPSILKPLLSQTHAKITQQVLDWSSPLPPNIKDTKWQLVVVADCTYNPDVVPDLVNTLRRIAEGNRDLLVLLAMKVRHESEMVFFDLMEKGGFAVREKCILPLPVSGAEVGEEIEIYVFETGAGEQNEHGNVP